MLDLEELLPEPFDMDAPEQMAPVEAMEAPGGPLPAGALAMLMEEPQRPPELDLLEELAGMANAAASEQISDEDITALAHQVHHGYTIDVTSRSEWEDQAGRAMKAAKQEKAPKNYPFPNSANVRYPLVATAALQFNARAYPALCQGRNLIRAAVGGNDQDGAKASRATRVSTFMSHQIVDGMPSWEHEMDVMTYQLPIIGSAFKKTFWSSDKDGPESKAISAFDLVVNSDTKSLEECPRITHRYELYPYQIDERKRDGRFLDVDISAEYDAGSDDQKPVRFLEQHCYYDLDGDGYSEPWIVTTTETTQTLVRITAGFDPQDIVHDGKKIIRIPREEYFTSFEFLPDPDGGFYGIGFGKLLDSLTEVIDTSFNQMLDAGHLQNAGGGFIGAGLDFQSNNEEFFFEPGKYYYVNNEGVDIKSAIVPMNHQGPSAVLFQLLGMMMESAKQMTSVQDILTGNVGAQTMQPTTLMALIDQGMKVFTAIYKRIYDSLTREFRIIYRLNRKYLSDDDYLSYVGQGPEAPAAPQVQGVPGTIQGGQLMPMGAQQPGQQPMQPQQMMQAGPVPQLPSVMADFADDNCSVTPVADPNSVTVLQKVARGSFLLQLTTHPIVGKLLDPQDILMRVLTSAEIDDIPRVLAKPTGPTPADQLQMRAAVADIAKKEADAEHTRALTMRDMSQTDLNAARIADMVMGHVPDYFENPPVPPMQVPEPLAE